VWRCPPPGGQSPLLVPVGTSVVDGRTRAKGLVAISTELADRNLNVLASDGSRYETMFVKVPGGATSTFTPSDLYVAYVAIDDGVLVSAQVTDALGKVITRI